MTYVCVLRENELVIKTHPSYVRVKYNTGAKKRAFDFYTPHSINLTISTKYAIISMYLS